MHRSPLLSLLTLASSAVTATTHVITVGANSSLEFSPIAVTAAVGDTLSFHFYTGTGRHSVVSSSFSSPCAPLPSSNAQAFFSGYITGDASGSSTFNVEVKTTDPIWFYCSLGSHCQEGMVGVVNPPSSGQDISAYKAAAENAAASAPGAAFGGVAGSASAGVSAATTMPTSSGSSTPGVSAATTMPPSSSSSIPGVSAETTMPTSSSSKTATGTESSGSVAATSKPSGANAGRHGDMSVMLALGFVLIGLVALMA